MDETWRLIESCHVVVYFAPETEPVYTAAGLKGYWMGYFASRSAALGSPPPEVVTATFYNFTPRMVARAIPDAWRYSSSEAVLAARLDVADQALRRLLGDQAGEPALAEAAALARRAMAAAPTAGRALFAAHAATALREFRGDGHIAALLAAGVDGGEANVLAGALGLTSPRQRELRGFGEDEWSAAGDRLRARGWLDETGAVTEEGRARHRSIEETTDALARPPFDALGPADTARLTELLREPVRRIVDGGGILFPDAMGMEKER